MLFILRHLLSVWLLSILIVPDLQSQQWKLDPENPPNVTITGTSTLHDWTVTTSGVQEVPEILTFDPENATNIGNFSFKVPVEGMDGGRGASMNDKIFEAFKSSDHPFVQYQQTQPATVEASAGVFNITSQGTLSMAGSEKSITVQCTGTIENGVLVLKGSKDLKMSEFGMTPPTAMFGQIKTNDDVVVNYEFRYTK